MKELTIKLAGTEYKVQMLTLGQMRDLSIGVVTPDVSDQQELVRISFDRSVSVISTALRKNYPEMTVAAMFDSLITPEEMRDAATAVLVFSGLATAPAKDAGESSGEAQAETA